MRRGDGEEGCGCGRRRCWGSVCAYLTIYICIIVCLTGGFGNLTSERVIRFVERINFSLCRFIMLLIEDLIWHRQVPLKVSILAWRLLQNRLPTKENLLTRGTIQTETNLCVTGCGKAEYAVHLFLHCHILGTLWQHVRRWIGVSGVEPLSIRDHFVQFTYYLGGSRASRSFFQLLWLLCIWLLWNERNNRLFHNVHTTTFDLLEKVKHNSYWWLKANNATFVYGSQRWWSDPLLCLSID